MRGVRNDDAIGALREYRAEGRGDNYWGVAEVLARKRRAREGMVVGDKGKAWHTKKEVDIFLYGNIMLGHGKGGYHIGCV